MKKSSGRTFEHGEFPDVLEGQAFFHSRSSGYLLEGDREVESNNGFFFPVLHPPGERFETCLFLGHGLNESAYTKLGPWAGALCHQLKIPVLIFPLSFHVNRRPSSWLMKMRGLYRSRSTLKENPCTSPFNAVISQRFAEKPERFFRGALQSYHDIRDLIATIRAGRFEAVTAGRKEPLLSPEVRMVFLGYSISGYLFFVLPCLLEKDLLDGFRLVLFSSCTRIADMNPVSVLVIDGDAFQRTKQFYKKGYKEQGTREFRRWLEEEEFGVWFQDLFFNEGGSDRIRAYTQTLGSRILAIGDPQDEVFPFEAIKNNLGPFVDYQALTLGRHEFPFNIAALEGKTFHDLGLEIRGSRYPSEPFRDVFDQWLEVVENFLCPNGI